MKKVFRDYKMRWWQVSLLKVYLLVLGLILGAYFPSFILDNIIAFWALFGALLVYFLYAMLSEKL